MTDWTGLAILLAEAAAIVVGLSAWRVVWMLSRPPRRTAGSAAAAGQPLDPGELALAYTTQTIRDEVLGQMELWVVQGRRRDGPVMLIVHGWADSRWSALAWLAAAASVSHQVVLFDLPGHGQSPVRRCTWGMAEIDLIGRLVAQVRQEQPGRAVVLMGYSLGGVLAMAAAERVTVEAVIGDSVFISPLATIRRWLRLRRLPVWPVAPLALAMMKWRWPVLGKLDLCRIARRLRCPVLLMHGEEDRLADVGQARAIVAQAERGELATWAGAGHNEAVRIDPAGYRQRLGRFVESAVRPYHDAGQSWSSSKD